MLQFFRAAVFKLNLSFASHTFTTAACSRTVYTIIHIYCKMQYILPEELVSDKNDTICFIHKRTHDV